MSMTGIGELASLGKTIIDKVIPDPVAREAAKLELVKAEINGDLDEIKTALSAILEEAKSSDPWTSRARPSFLYVMYAMILASIPMGILYAIDPETAKAISDGMAKWLEAIPGELYALFGAGYLGYSKFRSDDKAVTMGAKSKRLGIF